MSQDQKDQSPRCQKFNIVGIVENWNKKIFLGIINYKVSMQSQVLGVLTLTYIVMENKSWIIVICKF
jgi:hypothetical protein